GMRLFGGLAGTSGRQPDGDRGHLPNYGGGIPNPGTGFGRYPRASPITEPRGRKAAELLGSVRTEFRGRLYRTPGQKTTELRVRTYRTLGQIFGDCTELWGRFSAIKYYGSTPFDAITLVFKLSN